MIFLSVLSVIFHLTKGLDYEEAFLSLVLIVALLVTRKRFVVKSSIPDWRLGILRLVIAALVALGYGIIGFWLLDRRQCGFRDIGLSRYVYLAFGVSLMLFVFQAFSFWFIMLAYGLHFSFWVGAAIFLIVHFGTALPNAPANIGSSQFFCVLGLTLFGVDKTLATGFSIVVFILLTLPLLVIGFFALGQSGMTLSSIKNTIKGLRISS